MQIVTQNDTRPIVFFMTATAGGEFTGGSPSVTISQDGGAFVSPVGIVSEIGNGFYKLTPSGTDVSTLGPGRLRATAVGANNAYAEFQVIAQDLYAAMTPAYIGGSVWGFELTEAYSTFGSPSTYTASAMLWDMRQRAYNIKIAGTTLSIAKLDGTTAIHTLALDNASSPTSSTQAS